jgi:hypothetical protein
MHRPSIRTARHARSATRESALVLVFFFVCKSIYPSSQKKHRQRAIIYRDEPTTDPHGAARAKRDARVSAGACVFFRLQIHIPIFKKKHRQSAIIYRDAPTTDLHGATRAKRDSVFDRLACVDVPVALSRHCLSLIRRRTWSARHGPLVA